MRRNSYALGLVLDNFSVRAAFCRTLALKISSSVHAVNYTVFCLGTTVPITVHNLAFGICKALLRIVGIITTVPDRPAECFLQVYSVLISAIIAWGVLPPHLCAAWLGVLMISVVIFVIVVRCQPRVPASSCSC